MDSVDGASIKQLLVKLVLAVFIISHDINAWSLLPKTADFLRVRIFLVSL